MRTLLATTLAMTALVACAPSSAATRSFAIGGFDRVRSSVPYDVQVRTGGQPGVRATGPQDVLDRLDIRVDGGELVIGSRPGSWFASSHGARTVIEVSAPAVAGATLSGPGDMTIDRVRARTFTARLSGPGNLSVGALEAGHADLQLSGPGDMTLAGRAETVRIALSGPGDVRAGKLSVRDADLQLSGPGEIAIAASGAATGRLSGPGDITVTGGARCDIAKSGPGDVTCR